MANKSLILGVVALCTVPAATQAQQVLINENFNELTPALGVMDVGAFHTTGGSNVDILGPGAGTFPELCVAPTEVNCIDLGGTGGNPLGVLQSKTEFTLQPGVEYHLSFDLIGSERAGDVTATTVSFGPYTQTFNLQPGDTTSGVVTNKEITVSTPTTAFLTFSSDSIDPFNVGSILDNVVLTSSSAPEPATLGLMVLGLLGGAGFAGRRRRN